MKKFGMFLICVSLSTFVLGCSSETQTETQEAVDSAVEDVQEATDDAVEAVDEAADEAVDAVQDAVN